MAKWQNVSLQQIVNIFTVDFWRQCEIHSIKLHEFLFMGAANGYNEDKVTIVQSRGPSSEWKPLHCVPKMFWNSQKNKAQTEKKNTLNETAACSDLF